jgi:hypothetical protein
LIVNGVADGADPAVPRENAVVVVVAALEPLPVVDLISRGRPYFIFSAAHVPGKPEPTWNAQIEMVSPEACGKTVTTLVPATGAAPNCACGPGPGAATTVMPADGVTGTPAAGAVAEPPALYAPVTTTPAPPLGVKATPVAIPVSETETGTAGRPAVGAGT